MVDRPVRPMELSLFERAGRLLIWAMPVMLILWIAAFLWKWRQGGFQRLELNVRAIALRLLLPSALCFGIAYAWYDTFPRLNGVNLATTYTFNPDLGLFMGLAAFLALAWGVARPILRLVPSSR